MAKLQAEKWEDMKPDVRKLNEALEAFHTPPEPDDHFSTTMNQLVRSAEGLTHHITTRSQQQEEAEAFRDN